MTAVYVSAQQTALKVRPEAGGCNPLTGWPPGLASRRPG